MVMAYPNLTAAELGQGDVASTAQRVTFDEDGQQTGIYAISAMWGQDPSVEATSNLKPATTLEV